MTDRIRLFVAAGVPPGHLERLDSKLAEVKPALSGARWTAVDNQHVTLKFLGGVPVDDLNRIEGAVEEAARGQDPAPLTISSLGAFPNARRARVLWAGLDDPRSLLSALAHALDASFRPLGFEPEKRAFTPHLTLARFRVPARLADDFLALDVAEDDPFEVGEIRLYRSHLSPKGARYEVLRSIPL